MSPDVARTPLHALHLRHGGRMVPFAGYAMPVQYPAGLLKEHLHTRAQAGLFDDVNDAASLTRRPRRKSGALFGQRGQSDSAHQCLTVWLPSVRHRSAFTSSARA